MNPETLRSLPWGEVLVASFFGFVLVKLLARGGWINLLLLPVLAPLALAKLAVFSMLGRTRPYLERLRQSEEVSNQILFRGRLPGAASAPAASFTQNALREPLSRIAREWNAGHRWFQDPITLVLQGGEVTGFCRLFTFPRALGLGADRRVYRDVERVIGFLEESAKDLNVEWTVLNTIGLSGKVNADGPDGELFDSLADLRGTVFWRKQSALS